MAYLVRNPADDASIDELRLALIAARQSLKQAFEAEVEAINHPDRQTKLRQQIAAIDGLLQRGGRPPARPLPAPCLSNGEWMQKWRLRKVWVQVAQY